MNRTFSFPNVFSVLQLALLSVLLLTVLPYVTHAAITSDLDIGDSGADVTAVQSYLAQNPTLYPEGLVTGYYGSLTAAAVARYQCAQNIVCSGTAATTGYGRVGPATRASLNEHMTNGTGNSSDVYAPIMSADTVATTSTSATFSWTTNETARARVMYGTSWPFLYAIAPSVSETSMGTVHSVTLTNLSPNTQYYYVRESVDPSGNVQWTSAKTLRTAP